MTYYFLGIITGIVLSILNILFYNKDIQRKVKGLASPKAKIIDMVEPVEI